MGNVMKGRKAPAGAKENCDESSRTRINLFPKPHPQSRLTTIFTSTTCNARPPGRYHIPSHEKSTPEWSPRMNPSRSPVRRPRIWLAVLCLVGVVAAASLAQPKPAAAPDRPARFDYVGVGISLLRVDRETGRVEILEQRDAPGMTLTLEQARPWTWREVRIDDRPARPAQREPRPGRRMNAGEEGD